MQRLSAAHSSYLEFAERNPIRMQWHASEASAAPASSRHAAAAAVFSYTNVKFFFSPI